MFKKIIFLSIIPLLFLPVFLILPQPTSAIEKSADHQLGEVLVKLKNFPEVYRFNFDNDGELNEIIEDYKQDPRVEYAELNHLYKISGGIVLNDPDYSRQWYLPQINAPEAWEKTTGDGKVIIAVIDTGVDIDHPDLINNIWLNEDEVPGDGSDNDGNGFIDDIHGWNFVENNNDSSPNLSAGFNVDGVKHGTIIAGLINAQGNNGQGIAGVSWKSKIMPLRALNSFGEGTSLTAAKAIDYAVNNGADIINLSFTGKNNNETLYQSIKRAYEKGVTVIAAAGNEPGQIKGDNLDEIKVYPACYEEEVLGVAATDPLDQKAYFSNFGKSCIDLTAPGVGIYSTLYQNPTIIFGYFDNQPQFKDYYGGAYDGTSFSSPLVAGAAALIKAIKPNLTNKQIYQVLTANTESTDAVNPNYHGLLGSGRLNVAKAIEGALTLPVTSDSAGYFSAASRLLVSILDKGDPYVYLLNQQGAITNQFLTATEKTADGFFLTSGDIDLDGVDDIIVGSGKGMSPYVRIFDQAGNLKLIFLAYDEKFKGGVSVAFGDVENNGDPEIITAPTAIGGPHLKVFDRFGNFKSQFFAYDSNFNQGVNVAVGDVDNDGFGEIVTAPRGGNLPVRVFDRNGGLESEFYPYDKNFKGGVNLAVGDINQDDWLEIITVPLSGGGPHVKVFEYTGLVKGQFFAYANNFYGGVSVAIVDIDLDNVKEIITVPGPTGGPHFKAFDQSGNLQSEFFAFDKGMTKGLRIAGN